MFHGATGASFTPNSLSSVLLENLFKNQSLVLWNFGNLGLPVSNYSQHPVETSYHGVSNSVSFCVITDQIVEFIEFSCHGYVVIRRLYKGLINIHLRFSISELHPQSGANHQSAESAERYLTHTTLKSFAL